MELTDRQILKTPCGVLFSKTKIVGRYSVVNGVKGLECLVCGRNAFADGAGLIDHIKESHPKD